MEDREAAYAQIIQQANNALQELRDERRAILGRNLTVFLRDVHAALTRAGKQWPDMFFHARDMGPHQPVISISYDGQWSGMVLIATLHVWFADEYGLWTTAYMPYLTGYHAIRDQLVDKLVRVS